MIDIQWTTKMSNICITTNMNSGMGFSEWIKANGGKVLRVTGGVPIIRFDVEEDATAFKLKFGL